MARSRRGPRRSGRRVAPSARTLATLRESGAAANPYMSVAKGEEKQRCAMGMQCYHVRKLNSPEPVTLGPSHEGAICDKCKQAGYSPTEATNTTNDVTVCSQCGSKPASDSLITGSDYVPLCEDCSNRLVEEWSSYGSIAVWLPSRNAMVCDSCSSPADELVEENGDDLCNSCRAVFWTARTLFEEGVTDESEIIATMVYAAWDGRPWELAKNGEFYERFQRVPAEARRIRAAKSGEWCAGVAAQNRGNGCDSVCGN